REPPPESASAPGAIRTAAAAFAHSAAGAPLDRRRRARAGPDAVGPPAGIQRRQSVQHETRARERDVLPEVRELKTSQHWIGNSPEFVDRKRRRDEKCRDEQRSPAHLEPEQDAEAAREQHQTG